MTLSSMKIFLLRMAITQVQMLRDFMCVADS